MQRTDIHRPGSPDFNPGAYEFTTDFYQGASEDAMKEYAASNRRWLAAVAQYPAFAGNFSGKNTCDHCGAAFAYGCCFLHEPTNELVHVGQICAANTFSLPDRVAFLRKKAEHAIAAGSKYRTAVAKFLFDKPTLMKYFQRDDIRNDFLISLRDQLHQFGSLSARQVEVAEQVIARELEWEAKNVRTPVVEGKQIRITGRVLSTKETPNPYAMHGETMFKMTVKDDRGFAVFGTIPQGIARALVQQMFKSEVRVTFLADVAVSHDDPTFGFYAYPKSAEILTEVTA